jgi:hypothetical protein
VVQRSPTYRFRRHALTATLGRRLTTLLGALILLLPLPSHAADLSSASSKPTCRGVRISPDVDIQRRINASPPGTTFCFAKAVYQLTATLWTGDRFPRLDLRAGAVIDGHNGDFVGINGDETPQDRRGTVILGGVFQHFGNADAPDYVQPVAVRRNMSVRGTEFRENFNTGLGIIGDHAVISNIYTHHNGRSGLVVTQSCEGCPGPKGVVIQDSEIAFNNTRHLDPGFDAGGAKFTAGTDRMIVRRNEIHNNYGSGLWFDGSHQNAQIYGNYIHDNRNCGIFYEISYGGTKIHHNTLVGNGIGDGSVSWTMNVQLNIVSSDGNLGGSGGINIYRNRIAGSAYPLGVSTHSGRPITKQVFVHDNLMILRAPSTRTGGVDDSGTGEMFAPTSGNRFEGNTYRVPDPNAAYWVWDGQTLTWSQWQAAGHDTTGTVRRAG